MPIDFACTGCNKTLRVGDDTAGKQAKCPQCGAVLTIPAGSTTTAANSVPPPPTGDSFNPYQAPQATQMANADFGMSASRGPFQPSALFGSEVRTLAWQIMKENMGLCVGAGLIMLIISGVIGAVIGFSSELLALKVASNQFVRILVQLPFQLVGWTIQAWLAGGFTMFWMALVRGEQPTIGVMFEGQRVFGRIVGPTLTLNLIGYVLGLAMTLAPAMIGPSGIAVTILGLIAIIYITLAWGQYMFLLIDGHASGFDAFSMSDQIMHGNKLSLFGMMILLTLVAFGGILLCGIGLLFAYPYIMLCMVLAYMMMSGQLVRRTG